MGVVFKMGFRWGAAFRGSEFTGFIPWDRAVFVISKDPSIVNPMGSEGERKPSALGSRFGSFRQLGVPHFGVLIVRILLLGSPFFGNSPFMVCRCM